MERPGTPASRGGAAGETRRAGTPDSPTSPDYSLELEEASMSGDEEALREVVDKINAAARAMTDEDDEDEPPSGAPAPAPTAEAITLSSPSLEGMESPPGQVAMAVPAYPPSPMPRPSELGGGAATEDSPPAGAALVRTGTPRVRDGQQVRRQHSAPLPQPFSSAARSS
eukprot:COSAG04_NODE_846_length_9910_cov_10.499949_6_plen_169_part_00